MNLIKKMERSYGRLKRNATISSTLFFSLIFLFCFQTLDLKAQQNQLQLLDSIPLIAKAIQIDQLQQLYLLNEENTLLKYDVKGEQQFEYSNTLLGDVSLFDVSNPLNIALYYSDFQTIVLLDRNLTELQVISLFELNFAQVSSIGLSNNQQIWLYDETDFKLKKIDRQGKIIFESGDLSLAIGKSIQPTILMERDNKIFANDPAKGIFVFDLFGQYLYHLEVKGLTQFSVFSDHLVYFENSALKSWGLQSKLEQIIVKFEHENTIKQVLFDQNQRVYLLKENGIEIRQIMP